MHGIMWQNHMIPNTIYSATTVDYFIVSYPDPLLLRV